MQGLDAFTIVVVGTGFPIQQVQLEDFDFGGLKPQVEFHLPQALQASAGEYMLQIIPNRFQVGVTASQPTGSRIEILKKISLAFVEGYTTKRSLLAVGHNFVGNIEPGIGTAPDFMKHIAWPSDFSAVMSDPSNDPTLSLTTTIKMTDELTRTIRLEPLTRDDRRLYYEINFNWGQANKPLQAAVSDVLDQFSESVKFGSELIDRLAILGSNP